jgi:hypothetical protein
MSADNLDNAQELSQLALDAAVSNARKQAAMIDIHGNGNCIVCGNDVEPVVVSGKSIVGRFCSKECVVRSDL